MCQSSILSHNILVYCRKEKTKTHHQEQRLNKQFNRICVYCASSNYAREPFFNDARRLGYILAAHNIELVYGGGGNGLMGAIADAVLEKGGRVTGIIPRFMVEVEWAHKGIQNLEIVNTMAERKEKLMQNVDALVALPGGSGTFEELMEAITLKRLGIFTQPIIIVNTEDYYRPLKELMAKSIEERFMRKEHAAMYNFVDSPEEVIPAIAGAAHWDSDKINIAAVGKE